MLRALLGERTKAVDLNTFKVLSAVLLIHTIGPQTVIVLPGFVQGLVDYAGFSDKQAGFISSAEMTGMAGATVVMMFMVSRVNWRHVFLISLLLIVIGNFASIYVRDFTLLSALRFLVGVGGGWIVALSYAVFGMTRKPDRNFGFAILFVLIYGAVVFPAMPPAYESLGFTGVLVFFGAFAICGLPFVRFMPTSGEQAVDAVADAVDMPWRLKFMALATMFLYFVGNFAVWSYFFRIGVGAGIDEQQVGNGLALSQIFGAAGALTTVIVGARYGRAIPITAGIGLSIACVAYLLGPFGAFAFAAVASAYNYAWNMTHPYLLAAMASFDPSGKMVVYATAMQFLGVSVGPAFAATLITEGDYSSAIWLGLVLFVACTALILPPVRTQAALYRETETGD